MSLRWRIAVGLAVIAGIVCALAATGAYLSTKQQLQSSVDESLVARTHDANEPGPGGRPWPGPKPGSPSGTKVARNPASCNRRQPRNLSLRTAPSRSASSAVPPCP